VEKENEIDTEFTYEEMDQALAVRGEVRRMRNQ